MEGSEVAEDACTIAEVVHALLLEAHPHADDVDVAKASELVAVNLHEDDNAQRRVFLAIQNLLHAIGNGASAVEGERLLLEAVRLCEQWRREACKPD